MRSLVVVGLLAIAAPLQAQSLDTTTKALTVASLGLQGVDLAQTLTGLKAGTIREGNPVLAGLSGHAVAFSVVKMGLASSVALATWKLRADHPKLAYVLGVAINTGMAAVVSHNAKVVR